ncbi:MAG: GPW/gp25 family protein [Puniceicoccales bacterium]|jgi:type VI secretion system protein ImpF|nr:GPW/gp25 family protein [Puniceicoccales bacterium]
MSDSDALFKRLQPCLLDRLTDDDPKNKNESRSERVISNQKYRAGVLRDITWLFSASAHLPVEGSPGKEFKISAYAEVAKSVLNYGTRHIFGLTAPDMKALEAELFRALAVFEPRIIPDTLHVRASMERQIVSFAVDGDLWANPIPEKLFIRTKIDVESGAGAPISATRSG